MTRSVPRLHTPSRGSLSATPAAIPAGVAGSVRVIACPPCVFFVYLKHCSLRDWVVERYERNSPATFQLGFRWRRPRLCKADNADSG